MWSQSSQKKWSTREKTHKREQLKGQHSGNVASTTLQALMVLSEKLCKIFNKHHSPAHFKPGQQPETKVGPVHHEAKQLLYKHMAQHRRANSPGQDSAVPMNLKDKGHLGQQCECFCQMV